MPKPDRPKSFRVRALLPLWWVVSAISPLLVANVQAQTTWVGGVGNFTVGSNWSGGAVPSNFDSFAIDNGGTAQLSATVAVISATISSSSTLALLPGASSYLDVSDQVYVGASGLGTLTLGSEATLESSDFYAGFASGSSGVVSLDNAFLSPTTTYVGYQGSGSISLENGSTLESTTGYVGYQAGSSGLVELDGSTWNAVNKNQSDITVGVQGNGEIRARDSAISARNLILAYGVGTNGTVSADGGTVTVQQIIQVGVDGTGSLTLSNSTTATSAGLTLGVFDGSSGSLSMTDSTLNSTGSVFIGHQGNGVLDGTGAVITATDFSVADRSASTSTATLTGGSLVLTGALRVGNLGQGTLTLQEGGVITSDGGYLGTFSGATGTVNILNGRWESQSGISVGGFGDGTLNIGPQGSVTSTVGSISPDGMGGSGAATVTGGSWTVDDVLVVAASGSGNLSVSQGGEVSSDFSQIGVNAGSDGTVTVNNASWSTEVELAVGVSGSGVFSATNNASVTAGIIEVAANAGSTGSLTLSNSTVTTQLLVAGDGDASVEFNATRINLLGGSTVTETQLVGGFATGSAVINSGGLTIDTQGGNAQVTSSLSGAGALIKTGAGRLRLNNANTYAAGTFIEGGVLELTGNSNLGPGDVSIRTAELRAHIDSTVAGNLGGGIQLLAVEAGQTATFSAAANQTLTLAPLDFLLAQGSTLQVGSAGNTGNVILARTGATALTADTVVNVAAGTLTAANSALEFITSIAASTTVASGATLDFQDNLSIGGINALFGGGTVHTGSSNSTTLSVNSGNFSGAISGAGRLSKVSSGTLTLSGNDSTFTGGTVIHEGALIVNGSFTSGDIEILANGTLSGEGGVGSITLEGGTISLDNPNGFLIGESLSWQSGTIALALGPTFSGALVLSGDLTGQTVPSGPYIFDFSDAGWTVNTTYNLIVYDNSTINLSDFAFSNQGGFAGNFIDSGSALQFQLIAIPEPGTSALLLVAGLLAAARLRRRVTAGQD